MIPDFAGQTVIKARLGWGLRLWTDAGWELTLSEPVVITTADPTGVQQATFDPDVDEQPLPEGLQGLEGATISQLLVSREGDLGVQLSDRHLGVPASESYEAWQLAGPGGEMLICSPGGDLTHFEPLRKDPVDETDA